MLLVGTLSMAFFLILVGILQGHFGSWEVLDGARVWVIRGHSSITRGVIVCSYLFVCRFVHPPCLQVAVWCSFPPASLLPWDLFRGRILRRSSQCVSAPRQLPCRQHRTGCSTLGLPGLSPPASPPLRTRPTSCSAPSTSPHSSTFSSCFRRRLDAHSKRLKRFSRRAIHGPPGGWIAASA